MGAGEHAPRNAPLAGSRLAVALRSGHVPARRGVASRRWVMSTTTYVFTSPACWFLADQAELPAAVAGLACRLPRLAESRSKSVRRSGSWPAGRSPWAQWLPGESGTAIPPADVRTSNGTDAGASLPGTVDSTVSPWDHRSSFALLSATSCSKYPSGCGLALSAAFFIWSRLIRSCPKSGRNSVPPSIVSAGRIAFMSAPVEPLTRSCGSSAQILYRRTANSRRALVSLLARAI